MFRKQIVFILILNFLATNIFAQNQKSDCICPKVEMIEPSGVLTAGDTATFTAKINGDKGRSTYDWTVNAGTITAGQGTPTISVDRSDLSGATITATVEIGGWCPTCDNLRVSGAALVAEKPQARLIARMENPVCEYRQALMDSFFSELSNDPNATGYIFTFGSPRIVAQTERKIRANIKWRNFPPDRFVFVNGGGRSKKPTIDYWLVPAGADIPKPEPPVETEADFDTTENNPEAETEPKAPFIFSAEYYDGGGCIDENQELDLGGYAQKLKENPKSRGNIVIMIMTRTEFRAKEREILNFLMSKGIKRQRLRTFHEKTFGGVELWFLP